MEHSYAQQIKLTCPECNEKFLAKIWVVIDILERPDLLGLIRKGDLNQTTCPNGHTRQVDVTFLIYSPAGNRKLIFCSKTETTNKKETRKSNRLLTILHSRLPEGTKIAVPSGGIVFSTANFIPFVLEGDFVTIRAIYFYEHVHFAYLERSVSKYESSFLRSNDISSLDIAIILSSVIINHPYFRKTASLYQAGIFRGIGRNYLHCYIAKGNENDLEKGLSYCQEALNLTPYGSSRLPRVLNSVGIGFDYRYSRHLRYEDFQNAIHYYRRAVELCPSGSSELPVYMSNLSIAVGSLLYERTGKVSDLDEGIKICRHAISLNGNNKGDDLAKTLNILGGLLDKRYSHTSSPDELNEAIECFEGAIKLVPEGSPYLLGYLVNLSNSLRSRFKLRGNKADLERSLNTVKKAIRAIAVTSPDYPGVLLAFGDALSGRYDNSGDPLELNRAIKVFRKATRITPRDSLHFKTILNKFATTSRLLYKQTGEVRLLNDATQTLQQALDTMPKKANASPELLDTLGILLRDRYELYGNISDLDLAIASWKTAVDLTCGKPLSLPTVLSNLGTGFRIRHSITGSIEDLQSAFEAYEEVLSILPETSSILPQALCNLGTALLHRQSLTDNLADLDSTIHNFRQSVSLLTKTHPDWPHFNCNLGTALLERYKKVGKDDDLESAITYLEQAAETVSLDSPDYALILNQLATALKHRYVAFSEHEDLETSVNRFRQACIKGLNMRLDEALRGSKIWGRWALERKCWSEATEAYNFGIRAIEKLYVNQLLRSDKETWLSLAQEVATSATYALASNGNLLNAIETLENGRTKLLNETLELTRSDLKQLCAIGHEQTYQNYKSATERLSELQSTEFRKLDLNFRFNIMEELRNTQGKLDKAVKDIQQVPGYTGFFQNSDFDTVRHQLVEPLYNGSGFNVAVYLTLTTVGGVAFIVYKDRTKGVWLNFNKTELNSLLLERKDQKPIAGYLLGQLNRAPMKELLDSLLPIIGERIIKPLAKELSKQRSFEEKEFQSSTITLIPTGHLALLPLHAAPYRENGKSKTLLDEFSVSYTPSARALGISREKVDSLSGSEPRLLANVSNLSVRNNMRPLGFPEFEVEEISKYFADYTVFSPEFKATRLTVLSHMKRYPYIHFAGHAEFNPEVPLKSAIVLSNGELLTLADLFDSERLNHTRLAILSSCQTAITDFSALPEEAIGFPVGFLHAGVPGVVGNLWPVHDLSTALLMRKFYEYHLGSDSTNGAYPISPILALNKAQRWLRDVTNEELSRLFDKYRKQPSHRTRLNPLIAQESFRKHTLATPDRCPFNHPYYWAPFCFYGI